MLDLYEVKTMIDSTFKATPTNLNVNKAFTLAEIIIAMTVLGIVAALVISNIIRHIEIDRIGLGIKKSYSILSNAVATSEVENGPVSTWNFPIAHQINTKKGERCYDGNARCREAARAFSERYLIPYLSVSYRCDSNHRCFSNNASNGGNWCNSTGRLEGYGQGHQSAYAYEFRLTNGMSMGVMTDFFDGNVVGSFAVIVVDIDGPDRGASIVGRDVFVYTIGLPDRTVIASNNASAGPRQGLMPGTTDGGSGSIAFQRTSQQLLNSDWGGQCVGTTSNVEPGGWYFAGANCNVHYIKNNYRFTDAYPINQIARRCPRN